MNNSNTNAWFFLGAAIIGVVSAASVFLIEQFRQDKRRHAFTRDLARLDGQLSSLRMELETIRALQKEKNGSIDFKPNRRKLRSKSSAVSTTSTDEYNSAIDIDSSDLEFYDLSSDEASDSEKAIERDLCDIDLKLSDENSPETQFALDRLLELRKKYPQNSELLWRIAKAHKILALQSKDDETKRNHIFEGVESCEQAVKLRPKMAICHKWMAILVGMRSEFLPTKERILDGYTFKKHCDIAIQLTPNDPLLHHMLGRFAFEIAQLTWIEKTVAQTLFAEVPKMTIQDALNHFLEAEKLSEKDWKENKLFIAKCSLAVGKTESAIEWLSKAELSNSIEEDKVHEEVRNLLEKYDKRR